MTACDTGADPEHERDTSMNLEVGRNPLTIDTGLVLDFLARLE